MKIICAPDSFKESMTAADAARAMERGIRLVLPAAQVTFLPVADGGEGTCATLADALGGTLVEVACTDAAGRPRLGSIAHVPASRLAVIEVASACGLEHIESARRDALVASTRGVGDLVRAALDLGVATLIIGLGGSATNDAGAGMLAALGARFLDVDGVELPDGGSALTRLSSVDLAGLDPRLADVEFRVACDVTNPLVGPRGASAVFGPQKGADAEAIAVLDAGLTRWADVVERVVGRRVRDVPGAGAAGGLGAAFLALGRTTLESGADLVMDAVGLDAHLAGADLVLTGEGSLDVQSVAGKVPVKVAERAAAAGVPAIVFAGRLDTEVEDLPPRGVAAVVPIVRGVADLPQALSEGPQNLERATAMVCRLFALSHQRREPDDADR